MKPIVVVDLETTGLNNNPEMGEVDYIIEIGAVKIVAGRIMESYSSFVHCPIPLPNEIVELTGINDKDLENAPSIEQVLREFSTFCGDCIFVGHNLSFDYGFLDYHGGRYGLKFNFPQKDTLKIAQEKLKDKVENFRLSTLAEYYSIEFQSHRALNDAVATAKIYLKLGEK